MRKQKYAASKKRIIGYDKKTMQLIKNAWLVMTKNMQLIKRGMIGYEIKEFILFLFFAPGWVGVLRTCLKKPSFDSEFNNFGDKNADRYSARFYAYAVNTKF